MKPFYQSKTVIVNAITFIIAVATILAGVEWMPPKTAALIAGTVIPILNVALRFVTSEPIAVSRE